MDEGWTVVYSDIFEPKIQLIKAMLESHDVDCIVLNKKDSAYQSFGEISILVKSNQVILAKHLLSEHE